MKLRKVILIQFDNGTIRYRFLGRRVFTLSQFGVDRQLRSDHPYHNRKPRDFLRRLWKVHGKFLMVHERSANHGDV